MKTSSRTEGDKWKPLKRAGNFRPLADDAIALAMERFTIDRDAAITKLTEHRATSEWWRNDRYQVELIHVRADEGIVLLAIRRLDGGPILRDWRHFQQIKNELCGPECEAVELYPAESRKVDNDNVFYLWGWRNPLVRLPFGFNERNVTEGNPDGASAGLRQRKA